jgi:hypothetical protein
VVERDGTPVPGIEVRLAPEVQRPEAPESRAGTTDDSGFAEFTGLRPGRWRVDASGDGWLAAAGRSFDVPAKDAAVVVLARDDRPPSISVVDASGGPVAGARIDALAFLPGGAPGPVTAIRLATDEDGQAVLTGLLEDDAASIRLQVTAAGRPAAEVTRTAGELRARPLVIELEAGAVLAGAVLDAGGAPAANVALTLIRSGVEPGSPSSRFDHSSTADGWFRFTVLPRGAFVLYADGGDRGARRLDGIRTDGDRPVEDLAVQLSPPGTPEAAAGKAPPPPVSLRPLRAGLLPGTGSLRCRVIDPPPAYSIGLAREGSEDPERTYRRRRAAGEGEFVLRNIPAGSWRVLLLVDGQARAAGPTVTVLAGKEAGPVELQGSGR